MSTSLTTVCADNWGDVYKYLLPVDQMQLRTTCKHAYNAYDGAIVNELIPVHENGSMIGYGDALMDYLVLMYPKNFLTYEFEWRYLLPTNHPYVFSFPKSDGDDYVYEDKNYKAWNDYTREYRPELVPRFLNRMFHKLGHLNLELYERIYLLFIRDDDHSAYRLTELIEMTDYGMYHQLDYLYMKFLRRLRNTLDRMRQWGM